VEKASARPLAAPLLVMASALEVDEEGPPAPVKGLMAITCGCQHGLEGTTKGRSEPYCSGCGTCATKPH
jgi:hypothetical protein